MLTQAEIPPVITPVITLQTITAEIPQVIILQTITAEMLTTPTQAI